MKREFKSVLGWILISIGVVISITLLILVILENFKTIQPLSDAVIYSLAILGIGISCLGIVLLLYKIETTDEKYNKNNILEKNYGDYQILPDKNNVQLHDITAVKATQAIKFYDDGIEIIQACIETDNNRRGEIYIFKNIVNNEYDTIGQNDSKKDSNNSTDVTKRVLKLKQYIKKELIISYGLHNLYVFVEDFELNIDQMINDKIPLKQIYRMLDFPIFIKETLKLKKDEKNTNFEIV